MKLDRNINPNRRGKYALLNLRTNKIEWGEVGSDEEFLVIKLKDNGGLWFPADNTKPKHPISPMGITRPSIFIPRWASRINLEITKVRMERVQDISEEDAKAEGIAKEDLGYDSDNFHPPGSYGYVSGLHPFPKGFIHVHAKEAFEELWDSINSKRGFGWNVNPFVWAIDFKDGNC